MIQTQELPVTPLTDAIPKEGKSFWDMFSGLSLKDIITDMTSGMIDFAFKLIIAILVFYAGRFIIRRLYGFISKLMHKRRIEPSLTTFVQSLVNMVLYFILVITVIGILGLETSSFLAIFASAGVAIGMALSGTLQNFAGGVLILLLKPYKVGDYIETQGYSGTVKAIQIFHTIINTPDNKSIILPNGGLSTGSINNFSMESVRRVDLTICLAYDTDFDAAREAMLEIAKSDKRVLAEEGKKPFVGLEQMADSSINFTVRVWTLSENYWPLYFTLNEEFYKQLPKRGFSFPFPQMDVHLTK